MKRTLTSLAFVAATCAMAMAQVVQVQPHDGAIDIWGPYFNSHSKLTMTGKVVGIVTGRPLARADMQYALIVKEANGGQIEVEVGPDWFVKDQQAKIHVGDRVQVTGSKLMVDGHGVIVASQIRLHGQGGMVLALRRLSGKAFWLPTVTRVADNTPVKTATADDKTVDVEGPVVTPPNPPVGLLLDQGRMNVSTNTYNGYQNSYVNTAPGVSVVSGPYPFVLYPRGPLWW